MSLEQESADDIELLNVQAESNSDHNSSETELRSWIKEFPTIDDALDYLNSNHVIDDLADFGDGIKIRIGIKENFSSFSAHNLQRFLNSFRSKSIVLLFASKDGQSMSLFWKSKDIDYFLTFKPPERKTTFEIKELYGFIACFLINLLTVGHLGVRNDHNHSRNSNEIDLMQLVDKDGFNILKLCSEDGDVKCVEILLGLNIFKDDINDIFNAQSRAQHNKHFDVLLLLLKNNYTYPKFLLEDEFPDNLKQFVAMSTDIHEAVKSKNIELISKIIDQNSKLRHFYNKSNESVVKTTLNLKHFDIYEQLLRHDLILGPHEKIEHIYIDFNDNELTKLREIHFRCKKELPESHMNVLMMNTSISHDDMEKEGKKELVLRAYSVLNKDPEINPILKAVAASKRFTIIFDFKRTSIEVVDPTASKNMRGVFYPDRKICIGAKQLLDPLTEHETFGTLAHELGHYAMDLTFKNRAKPYHKSDQKTKEEYKKVVEDCRNNCEKDEIIGLAFSYETNMHSAELIVRVLHLLAMYHNQPDKSRELREDYPLLFNFHSNVVIPAVNRALPAIKDKADKEMRKKDKKISNLSILLIMSIGLGIMVACLASWYFYKPNYKFDELSDEEKSIVRNGHVLYKNASVKLSDLFPNSSNIFQNITSDHISSILDSKILNFDDAHLHYLDKQIKFKWENLTINLKENFLNSDLIFQGETVKLKVLSNLYSGAYKALTSQQIVDVLSGNALTIGKKFVSDNNFYVERKFILKDAQLILLDYVYGSMNFDNFQNI